MQLLTLYTEGKDATEAFEDVGHSDEARALLPAMKVGEFEKGPNVNLATLQLFSPILNSEPGERSEVVPVYCSCSCYGECCSADVQVRSITFGRIFFLFYSFTF
jgi:cytochrome b involved in lipid metabolism